MPALQPGCKNFSGQQTVLRYRLRLRSKIEFLARKSTHDDSRHGDTTFDDDDGTEL